MKRIFLSLGLVLSLFIQSNAQETKVETAKEFMQITTVESVISAGFGRSKMLITNPDGSTERI